MSNYVQTTGGHSEGIICLVTSGHCSHTRPHPGPGHGPASAQVLSPGSLLAGVTVLALSHFPAGAKLCRGVEGVTMCDM